MTKTNNVNFSDVAIMYGTTMINGNSGDKLRQDLSIRNSSPNPGPKVTYCIPGPTPTASLSGKAKHFLEYMKKIFRLKPVRGRRRNTVIYIPAPATDPKEKQIQEMNYCSFINVMAEMFKKYAPKILN